MNNSQLAITEAIARYQAGDKAASEEIWRFAFPVIRHYALRVMQGQPRTQSDEEDVAISSIGSLLGGMDEQRFPRLTCGKDLIRIAYTIAWRKAKDLRNRAAVRHGDIGQGGHSSAYVDHVAAKEHGEGIDWIDELDHIHSILAAKDPLLVQILKGLLNDNTVEEISKLIGRSQSTVKRKCQLIEQILQQEWLDVTNR